MQGTSKRSRERNKRRMLVAALLSGGAYAGLLADASPAQAAGTAANTVISNTASATYNDPNNTGTTLNATSNTVTVTVAEVAGITVGGVAVNDPAHPGMILPGDVVNYDFVVTNIGNAANTFALPGMATVSGNGTAGTLLYSTDGGATFPNSVPSGGLAATASIPANGSIVVRVPVTVSASAATGNVIKVQLGNTGSNDNAADTQNIAYPDSATGNDVHTDSTTAQNGQREASYFQNGTVATQPVALALILLTRTGFTPGATPAADVLTYNLELKVNSSAPAGANASHALTPADLAPTAVTVNGASVSRVLISDAVPAATALASVGTVPSGWTAVYSVTPASTDAAAAAWTTTAPSDLSTVTRVGFINPNTIARSADVSGFTYAVTATGASQTAPTQINNIAQVFGQSVGDSTNALVFDESGDQNPSNFNSDGSQGTTYTASTAPSGVANPSSDGTDPGNNNSGTGTNPGGRDNIYVVSPAGIIQNGPAGHPSATGPTGSADDDFTDLSAPIAAGTAPGATITPAAVLFNNTLRNPGTTALAGSTLLLPAAPATATDVPANTTVTLTYSGTSATYTYNGTQWTLTSGTAISIPSIPAATSVNYTASVQLPAGTALSTDTLKGFPVTILADVDANGNGVADAGESTNRTIDSVFTGFLKVTKLARIVAADGTTVIQDYSAGPTSANIQPGRFIDYKITYQNIATATGSGVSDQILNASAATITEDGTSGTNNWALAGPTGLSLTSNVTGSATDSGSGSVTFFNGNPPASGTDKTGTVPANDVTKYVDTASGPVPPGASLTFIFRRKIN